MHGLGQAWSGLHLVWKILIAAGAILGFLVKFREDLQKTWEWMVAYYDSPVLGCFQECVREVRLNCRPNTFPRPLSADQVSTYLKRKPSRVVRSLRRLERQGKIREYPHGWMIPVEHDWMYRGGSLTPQTKIPKVYPDIGAVRQLGSPKTEFTLHNEGEDTAHNVQIEPLNLSLGEAVFPTIATIRAGDERTILPEIDKLGVMQRNDLAHLMEKQWDEEGKFVDEFCRPMKATYEDYMKNKFQTTFDLVYLPMRAISKRNRSATLPADNDPILEIRNVEISPIPSSDNTDLAAR